MQSMTGYSRLDAIFEGVSYSLELKTLNSKALDVRVKLPSFLSVLEITFLKQAKKIRRGKVDLVLTIENSSGQEKKQLDKQQIVDYLNQLSEIAPELKKNDLLAISLGLPNIFTQTIKQEVSKGLEDFLIDLTNKAILRLEDFRKQEGYALQKAILEANTRIQSKLKQIEGIEEERKVITRKRLMQAFEITSLDVDPNRYEQEVIYYIEKLDVSEEKVRLDNHCKYFEQQLGSDQPLGKKLGFIVQEMGREINTIGSKANHEGLQRIVIGMKEDLEVIKEQILNVL